MAKYKKATIFLLIGIFLLIYFLPKKQTTNINNKLNIAASFYPLVFIAENIGGELVQVTNLTPVGAEPHEYEPSAKNIQEIYKSRLLIYNGGDLDLWADKIGEEAKKQKIKVINMVQFFSDKDLIKNGSIVDPHIWVDPIFLIKEAEIIYGALSEIDPKNVDYYKKNLSNLILKIKEVDQEYKTRLSQCSFSEIITSHDAFRYLAKRYGFKTISISGISPDEEPSSKKMGEIVGLARKKNIKYILFETLVSPKLSETIAKEVGAKTLILNAGHGLTKKEINTEIDYISIMKSNLNNLEIALDCQ